MYYSLVTGELEKEAQTYQLWIQSYPRDRNPYVNLVTAYIVLGRYEEALPATEQALRLGPEAAVPYFVLASEYFSLNRVNDAKHVLDQAIAKKVDGGYLHLGLYRLGFLQGDANRMARELVWGKDKPGDEDMFLSAQADTEAYHGRLDLARDFTQQAVDSAIHADSKETAALWEVNGALQEVEFGNFAAARRVANAALLLAPGRDVKTFAALALARAGDGDRANRIAKELEKTNPTNTILNFYWLPAIKAATELRHGESAKALISLEVTSPYELGQTYSSYGNLYPVYLRGEAYLLARNGPAAASEFQKFADYRGIVLNSPLVALACVQLARAQMLSGDFPAARKSYERFFLLWADADAKIPVLKQAKVEYERLIHAKTN
jgi:tetratricopeptide (TPR) repeat protein